MHTGDSARLTRLSPQPIQPTLHTHRASRAFGADNESSSQQAAARMVENGHGNGHMNGGSAEAAGNGGAVGTFRVKAGLAQMLKGGVIMGTYVGCG